MKLFKILALISTILIFTSCQEDVPTRGENITPNLLNSSSITSNPFEDAGELHNTLLQAAFDSLSNQNIDFDGVSISSSTFDDIMITLVLDVVKDEINSNISYANMEDVYNNHNISDLAYNNSDIDFKTFVDNVTDVVNDSLSSLEIYYHNRIVEVIRYNSMNAVSFNVAINIIIDSLDAIESDIFNNVDPNDDPELYIGIAVAKHSADFWKARYASAPAISKKRALKVAADYAGAVGGSIKGAVGGSVFGPVGIITGAVAVAVAEGFAASATAGTIAEVVNDWGGSVYGILDWF